MRLGKTQAHLYRLVIMEVPPRFELGIRVLQTHALPLGYGTIYEKEYTRYSFSLWSG